MPGEIRYLPGGAEQPDHQCPRRKNEQLESESFASILMLVAGVLAVFYREYLNASAMLMSSALASDCARTRKLLEGAADNPLIA